MVVANEDARIRLDVSANHDHCTEGAVVGRLEINDVLVDHPGGHLEGACELVMVSWHDPPVATRDWRVEKAEKGWSLLTERQG